MQRHVLHEKTRRAGVALVALLCILATSAGSGRASADRRAADPIVIGSTLSLTGAFAATGAIHKVAGETFIRDANAHGGWLGRPLKWVLLDDESDASKVSGLYEKLISQDHVDLIMGPYATPNIVAAQAVAERHGYVLPNHTAVLTYALTYKCQFPTWSTGPRPNLDVPKLVFAALKSEKHPPKRIAFVTNSGGSTNFISYGPPDSSEGGAVDAAKRAGFNVVLDLKYPPTTSDWGSIAAQIRDAHPDVLWNGGLGVDPVNLLQAMQQLNYRPPQMFTLFPAPGPLLAMGKAADRVMAVSLFEPNGRLLKRLGKRAQDIVKKFGVAAKAANLSYRVFETQAAASWSAWEVLGDGVTGTKSLDNGKICNYLLKNGAKTTFVGTLKFNQNEHNFPAAHDGIKQIQNNRWVIVWPPSLRVARLLGAS